MRGSGAAPGTPDRVIRSKAFAYITGADFLVRSAYQMGKTPLLPIFAAALGADVVLLAGDVSDGDTIRVTAGADGLIIGDTVAASNRPRPNDAVVH